jgi:hypothetical protein
MTHLGSIHVKHRLGRGRVEAQERLRHRIYLVVVGAVREGYAFFNEIVYPGRKQRMGQVDVAGLDERADRGRTREYCVDSQPLHIPVLHGDPIRGVFSRKEMRFPASWVGVLGPWLNHRTP